MISIDPGRRTEKAPPTRGRATSNRIQTMLWRVATWGGFAVLGVLSLLPGKWDIVDVDFAEDIHHFAAYLLLGIAAGATYPKNRLGWAVAFGIVAGGFELLQHFSPGREAGWIDFLSSAAGGLVGLGISWAWCSLIARDGVVSGVDRPG